VRVRFPALSDFLEVVGLETASVIWWSEFLATDPEVRVRLPALSDFLEVVGLELGPLSLVSITEELLGRNSSGTGLDVRKYGRRDFLR
jgi:hypothetical protein